jgi:hypothetical protein
MPFNRQAIYAENCPILRYNITTFDKLLFICEFRPN